VVARLPHGHSEFRKRQSIYGLKSMASVDGGLNTISTATKMVIKKTENCMVTRLKFYYISVRTVSNFILVEKLFFAQLEEVFLNFICGCSQIFTG